MKWKLLIACAGLQIAVLLVMAGHREWIFHQGQPVYFRTAPVDPRDYMRGDYVRLRYGISSVPKEKWRGDLVGSDGSPLPKDTRVYASLVMEEDVAKLVSLGTDRPKEGLYLRGRLQQVGYGVAQVRYGMEAFFVEQGTGLELERGGTVGDIQVPLEMLAFVSPGGIGVLNSYRWCSLGIGLSLNLTNTALPANTRARINSGTVVFLNSGSNDLAVVDIPNGGCLALVPVNEWGGNPWQWSHQRAAPQVEQKHIVVLKPGERYSIKIDFNDPRWAVTNSQKRSGPQLLSRIEPSWNSSFRLEYCPPSRETLAGLRNAELVWHGEIQTRRFNVGGAVD